MANLELYMPITDQAFTIENHQIQTAFLHTIIDPCSGDLKPALLTIPPINGWIMIDFILRFGLTERRYQIIKVENNIPDFSTQQSIKVPHSHKIRNLSSSVLRQLPAHLLKYTALGTNEIEKLPFTVL